MTIDYIDHSAPLRIDAEFLIRELRLALASMTEKALKLQKENDELRSRGGIVWTHRRD